MIEWGYCKPHVIRNGGKWYLVQRTHAWPALYLVLAEADTVRGLQPAKPMWRRFLEWVRRALG